VFRTFDSELNPPVIIRVDDAVDIDAPHCDVVVDHAAVQELHQSVSRHLRSDPREPEFSDRTQSAATGCVSMTEKSWLAPHADVDARDTPHDRDLAPAGVNPPRTQEVWLKCMWETEPDSAEIGGADVNRGAGSVAF